MVVEGVVSLSVKRNVPELAEFNHWLTQDKALQMPSAGDQAGGRMTKGRLSAALSVYLPALLKALWDADDVDERDQWARGAEEDEEGPPPWLAPLRRLVLRSYSPTVRLQVGLSPAGMLAEPFPCEAPPAKASPDAAWALQQAHAAAARFQARFRPRFRRLFLQPFLETVLSHLGGGMAGGLRFVEQCLLS